MASTSPFPCQTASLLQGETIKIPNLYDVLSGWAARTNPNGTVVEAGIEAYIRRCVPEESRQKKYLASKLSKLALLIFPDASAQRCVIAGKYIAWVFYWDDELDCGSLTGNVEDALLFVDRTVNLLRSLYCCPDRVAVPPHRHDAVTAFTEIGNETLSGGYRAAENRFLDLNIAHVRASMFLFQQSTASKTLTVGEYIKQRIQDSAAKACLHLSEYVYDLQLPDWTFEMEDVNIIIRETAIMTQTNNDLLSLAKEVLHEPSDTSLIPILMQQEQLTAQGGIDRAVGILKDSRGRFKAAEQRLLEQHRGSSYYDGLKVLIQASKDLVMGSLEWSYATPRYMETGKMMENGDVIFELRGPRETNGTPA